VNWVGERGLELILNVRIAFLSSTWFYFSLHLGTEGNEQLNYLSQAQGLISFDNLILKPVVGRAFKYMQEQGKIPSRNLAVTMVALDNGTRELEKLIKDSLKKYISFRESEPEAPSPRKSENKEDSQQVKDNIENLDEKSKSSGD
jgi:hypothetical protein